MPKEIMMVSPSRVIIIGVRIILRSRESLWL
jgi:hypothetical protein